MHAASAGLLMHDGSSGPVGSAGGGTAGAAYGPPWHTGSVGWLMHAGSSGPVGGSPGSALALSGAPAIARPTNAAAVFHLIDSPPANRTAAFIALLLHVGACR